MQNTAVHAVFLRKEAGHLTGGTTMKEPPFAAPTPVAPNPPPPQPPPSKPHDLGVDDSKPPQSNRRRSHASFVP